MSATAESAKMAARGIDERRYSRANDRRRGGFVESAGGGTVLDAIRGAALVAAAALEGAGHWCALQAFSSNTRAMVRVQRVKAFGEDIGDAAVQARLAAIGYRDPGRALALVRGGQPAAVFVDAGADAALKHASRNFAADLERVSGRPAALRPGSGARISCGRPGSEVETPTASPISAGARRHSMISRAPAP